MTLLQQLHSKPRQSLKMGQTCFHPRIYDNEPYFPIRMPVDKIRKAARLARRPNTLLQFSRQSFERLLLTKPCHSLKMEQTHFHSRIYRTSPPCGSRQDSQDGQIPYCNPACQSFEGLPFQRTENRKSLWDFASSRYEQACSSIVLPSSTYTGVLWAGVIRELVVLVSQINLFGHAF